MNYKSRVYNKNIRTGRKWIWLSFDCQICLGLNMLGSLCCTEVLNAYATSGHDISTPADLLLPVPVSDYIRTVLFCVLPCFDPLLVSQYFVFSFFNPHAPEIFFSSGIQYFSGISSATVDLIWVIKEEFNQ